MGFESMRSGHARLPTYIVAGLLLTSFLLMCNWWSLSTQNTELLRQMDEMGRQLNICSDEKYVLNAKKNSLDSQIKNDHAKAATVESNYKEELSKLKKQKADLEKALYNAKQDASYCKTELESLKKVDTSKEATLQSLRLEKNNLLSQLSIAKEKITQLEESGKKMAERPLGNMPKAMSSTEAQKKVDEGIHEVLQEPSLSDGPVNDGNHEINKDIETALENVANEEVEDNMEPDTVKRPPTKLR